MLEPTDRRLLFELLRPPAGYRLSCAIGTTYSLDLMALLVTPLAFTLFDWETKEGRLTASPIALLESLRRYADRITLFCNVGGIHPPTKTRQLYGYLEQSVVEVAPPRTGVFHAKLWVLRFEPVAHTANEEWPIQYRLLCPSRNLTFDRSWDTMLALEGVFAPRAPKLPQNQPLVRFVSRLPTLAARPPAPSRATDHIGLLVSELAKVSFTPPDGFDEVRFWPLGIDEEDVWPFPEDMDRLLVVSPFVSDSTIKRLSGQCKTTLLSRSEELMRLMPATLKRLAAVYTLDPAAEADAQAQAEDEPPVEMADDAVTNPETNPGTESHNKTATPISESLSGLHAKVYIADQNSQAHIWTGSANSTSAAFGGNVEILVELTGRREVCGIDAVLEPQKGRGLRTLLQPFLPPATVEVDAVQEKLDRLLEDAWRAVAGHDLRIHVSAIPEEGQELFNLDVTAGTPLPPNWKVATTISCRPITLRETWQQTFAGAAPSARFQRLHFERLTSFVVFRIEVEHEGRRATRDFVVNLPVTGLPEDRRERLLLALLRNSAQLLKYLLLLLAEDGWDARTTMDLLDDIDRPGRHRSEHSDDAFELPLLEPMLKALSQSPDKLDRIAQLIADLEKTSEGRAIIPGEFYEVWRPIWEVRTSNAK